MTVRTIDEIFRDFNIDGVPLSGLFHPFKPDIRDTLKALFEGGNFPDNRIIRLNNANEGTPNEIIVTASVDIPAAAYQVLYILNVTQENTGPVKVTGAINRDLVTNTNQPVIAGYLQPGMALLCIDTGTELRLLSYGDAEAILTAAEGVLDDLIARSVGAFPSDADAEQYLADRSLAAGEGTIYFNTTDKVWKYWDGNSWQAFPYATVADGAVTDSKLPEFSPTSSPSTAKMRFQASSAAGVLAGAIQRPVNLKLSERLDAADFGVKADGVTNDTAAMVAAFEAMEETGRPLFLPAGIIMVDAGALIIGDGSDSSYSTKNGQAIFGAGENAYMNPGAPESGIISGTMLRARAGSSGNMLTANGGMGGISMSGFAIDCADVASRGLYLNGVSHSDFERITIKEFKTSGLSLLGRKNSASYSQPNWAANNTFKNVSISSTVNVGYGNGLYLDGDIESNRDPHRNTFINLVVQVNRTPQNPSYAALFNMCDSNTFIECDFNVVGTGIGFSLMLNNSTPGHPFPQNNFFYGCSFGQSEIGVNGEIGDHFFVNFTTRDGEPIPTHPKLHGFTDMGEFFSHLVVNRDGANVELKTRDGSKRYRMINNSTASFDGGVLIQKWSSTSNDWVSYFSLAADGTPSIRMPGIGLKAIAVGDVDTGGTGFRRLVVAN